MNSSNSKSTRERKRTAMACTNCRVRKLKCRPPESADGDPCERCVKEGVPCQYRPVDSSSVSNNRTPSNYLDQDSSPVNLYPVHSLFPPNQQSAPTANPQYCPVQPPTPGGYVPNQPIFNPAAQPPYQANSFYPTQQYHPAPSPYPAQYSYPPTSGYPASSQSTIGYQQFGGHQPGNPYISSYAPTPGQYDQRFYPSNGYGNPMNHGSNSESAKQ